MTPRLPAVLVLLALLAAGATPARAQAPPDCSQQHRRVRLPDGFAAARLSFVGLVAGGRSRLGAGFPAADLRELRIVADWTDVEDVHVQRLELYGPDGALYQRFTRAFTGQGRPVTVTTRLPVAGSPITTSGLYGAWCAELFLDDEEAPIARRGFVLTAP